MKLINKTATYLGIGVGDKRLHSFQLDHHVRRNSIRSRGSVVSVQINKSKLAGIEFKWNSIA